MSLADLGLILFPEWLRDWIRFELLPMLGLHPYQIALGTLRGMFDTIFLFSLSMSVIAGGQTYMQQQYTLPLEIQATVLKWAIISDGVARQAGIPREVPLVLWFKENSMRAVNPELCTGIMGVYDLVRSGERPCFTPGQISDFEVREQLIIGANEFKKRCPQISYYTQNPEIIKTCYFAYNAGVTAAATREADQSAYVMNNYDESYRDMVYSDIVLGTVRVEQLGAWPTHIAMQSLITSQLDGVNQPFSIALLDTTTRVYDWLSYQVSTTGTHSDVSLQFPEYRDMGVETCLSAPSEGKRSLRPNLNPVTESPILTQDIHGCSYALPGIDVSSRNRKALLQAPMPGEITTYTDQWYNSTIRIENEEWIVIMLHPRSYLVEEGFVRRGQPVGVMGAIGNATGPHVHYTVYDKQSEAFVDPALFIP